MYEFTAYDRVLNAPWLMERFRDRYVDRKRLRQVGLMWNSLLPQYEPRCLPTEEIAQLGIPRDNVEQLEPWEDIDAYLFDGAMDWVVAVTHEDAILCLGV